MLPILFAMTILSTACEYNFKFTFMKCNDTECSDGLVISCLFECSCSMYGWMNGCIYVQYVLMFGCLFIGIDVCMYSCIDVCMYRCMYECMFLCMDVWVLV